MSILSFYNKLLMKKRRKHCHIKHSNVKLGKNVFIDKGITLKIGEDCEICSDVSIFGNGSVTIGDNVYIGGGTIIVCTNGKISIGNNSLLGPQLYFINRDHIFKKGELIRNQGYQYGDIIVGEDCWIGQGSTILKGSIIKNGCVIGAKSLVKGTFNENMVCYGVPCKEVRKRN